MRSILWQAGFSSHPGRAGNCAALQRDDFGSICAAGLFHAGGLDAPVYQGHGADFHRRGLPAGDGNNLPVLGHHRDIRRRSAQHWQGDHMSGDECDDLLFEYCAQCGVHFWPLRRTPAWGYRCGHCHGDFPGGGAIGLRGCFHPVEERKVGFTGNAPYQ